MLEPFLDGPGGAGGVVPCDSPRTLTEGLDAVSDLIFELLTWLAVVVAVVRSALALWRESRGGR